ncbi:putative serine esterase-domain-containing protein [Staphylotrichum tortipilum]|uniref:Endonuclease III homolog n=1 Tax=Staphylotrichum tortipilum TaxID=2831512 RepID=A0AAN6MIV0_9PEZI|nr:putative serine esterase-domain-containing protein [Staphylotrichum longicolle]
MESYAGGSLEADHLCVLVHGLWGNPNHMASVAKALRAQYPRDQVYILVAKRNSGSFTYDGIECGGERVCLEIEEELEVIKSRGGTIKKLSVVGYSLGGLVARYAIGLLFARGVLDGLECMNFTAFASPFLGVRTPLLGWPNQLFNVLGARTLCMSGRQLFGIDCFRDTGKPLLAVLADPNSIFMSGLARFKRHTLYTNITNDRSAVYYTTGISKTDPYTDLSRVHVRFLPGWDDVILDPAHPVSPAPPPSPEDLPESIRKWIRRLPLMAALTFFIPIGVVAFLVNSAIQTVRSSRRVKLHESGLAGIRVEDFRVNLWINGLRGAVEDAFENLNSAQRQAYLEDEEGGSSSGGEEGTPGSSGDENGDGDDDGGRGILALERKQSRQQEGGFPTLALAPYQFAAIQALDRLPWRKYHVWIHKHRHTHAAIIVRIDKPAEVDNSPYFTVEPRRITRSSTLARFAWSPENANNNSSSSSATADAATPDIEDGVLMRPARKRKRERAETVTQPVPRRGASRRVKDEVKTEVKTEADDVNLDAPLKPEPTIKTELKPDPDFDTETKPRPARKPARTTTDPLTGAVTTTPPTSWQEMYDLVKEMRLHGAAANAAVDTMGCERLADPAASARDRRFQTLVALMLSSQTKDTVTAEAIRRLQAELPGHAPGVPPGLNLENMLAVEPAVLNEMIGKVGFHNNKTNPLLTSLPGVGPKMAHLCMSATHGWNRVEGIGVDVHVHRITNLWGWQSPATKTPEETRKALEAWLPKERWKEINWLLVGFGQAVCLPVGRKCGDCELGLRGGGLCRGADRGKVAEGRRRRGVVKEEGVKVEVEGVNGEVKTEGVKMELVTREGVKKEAADDHDGDDGLITAVKPDPAANKAVKPEPVAKHEPNDTDIDVKVKTEPVDDDDAHVSQLPTSPQVKTEDTT